jgi:hypothetical protein
MGRIAGLNEVLKEVVRGPFPSPLENPSIGKAEKYPFSTQSDGIGAMSTLSNYLDKPVTKQYTFLYTL